jgi:hypothetical protein
MKQGTIGSGVKIAFQGSRVTSDGGLILVRELDERLGFGELIHQHLTYSRNGYFESTCFHPLLLFNEEGDCLAAKLQPGNVHSAEGWEEEGKAVGFVMAQSYSI